MTAQQARWRVLRHLISLLFTLSLVAVFALALWRVRPESFAMWLASLLVAVHVPGITLDAWQCIHFLTLRVGHDPVPQRASQAGAPTPSIQRRKPMTARKAILSVSALLVLTVLLIGGCRDDENPLTGTTRYPDRVETRDFDTERLASILDFITEDEVVDLARREHPQDVEKSAVPLGSEYYAHVWRPDLVEAWVFAMTYDPPVPVCDGSGFGFIRCVKRYLDDGEDCVIHKEGGVYHAHLRPE